MRKLILTLFTILSSVSIYAQTVFVSANFETSTLPTGWSKSQATGSQGWKFGTTTAMSSDYWSVPTHTKIAASNDDACNCDMSVDYLIIDTIDLSSATSVFLKFDAFSNQIWGSTGHVIAKRATESSWTNIYDVPASDDWQNGIMVNLNSYVGTNAVIVAFHHNDNGEYADGFAIDNVTIYEPNAYDIKISSISTLENIIQGTSATVSGSLTNIGYETVNSINLVWTDGTNTYSNNLSGLNIAPLGSYDFASTDLLSISSPIEYNITISTNSPNNNQDADEINNTSPFTIHGLSRIPTKRIVFEEKTGTWCGWCPRGMVYMDSLHNVYPVQTIGIAVHNADPMEDATYDGGIGTYAPGGYPGGCVDRVIDQDPGSFFDGYEERKSHVPFADVLVKNTYDQTSRTIDIAVETEILTQASGSYRFNCVIIEDSVRGTANGYKQVNYYSGGNTPLVGSGIDWQAESDPVSQYKLVYNHVARSILGVSGTSINGTPSSISATTFNAGDVFSYDYQYVIPSTYNENEIYIIGWISHQTTGEIINAYKSKLHVDALVGDANNDGFIDNEGGEINGDIDENGIIDNGEISGDSNGDGTIAGDEISGDTDGDGYIWTGEIAGDINGDGDIGSGEIVGDISGNGIIDGNEVEGDSDGNGIINGTDNAINKIAFAVNLSAQIYPNPNKGEFYLDAFSNTDKVTSIKVYNITGQEVYAESIASGIIINKKIDLSNFSSGTYFVRIENSKEQNTLKVVIE